MLEVLLLALRGLLGGAKNSTKNPNPKWRDPGTPKEWEGGKYVKDRPDYTPYVPTSTVPRDTSARTTVPRSGGSLPGGTFGTKQTFNTSLVRKR